MKSSGMITAIGGNIRSCRIWNGSIRPPARKRAMPYAVKMPMTSARSVPSTAARALFLRYGSALFVFASPLPLPSRSLTETSPCWT